MADEPAVPRDVGAPPAALSLLEAIRNLDTPLDDELNELANEYKDNGVHVLAVNLDKSPDRVTAFMEKIGVSPKALLILRDPDAKVVAAYVARSMPTSFIIDKSGVIRFVHFGYSDKDPLKWRQEIDELIKESVKK